MQIAPVLNRATEMSANGGDGVVLPFGGEEQQRRAAAEPENLRTVRFQISHLGGNNFVFT